MAKAAKDITTAAQLKKALLDIQHAVWNKSGSDLVKYGQKVTRELNKFIGQLTKKQLEDTIKRPKDLEMLLSLTPKEIHSKLIGLLKNNISAMTFKTQRLKGILKETAPEARANLLDHLSPAIFTKKHNRHIIYFLKLLPENKRLDFLKENNLLDGSHGAKPLPNPAKSGISPDIPLEPIISGIRRAVKAEKRDDLLWKNCRYYFNVLSLLPKGERLNYLKSLSPEFKKMIADYADEYAYFHTDVKSHYGYFDEKDRRAVVKILEQADPSYVSRKAGTILKHLPDKQIPGFIRKHAEDLYKYVTGGGASYTHLLKCVAEKHHDVLRDTFTTIFQQRLEKLSDRKLYDMYLRNTSMKSVNVHFDRVHKDFTKLHLIIFIRAKLYELNSHQHSSARLHKPAMSAPKQAYETLLDTVKKDDPEIIRKYLMKDNKGSYPDDKLFQLLCAHVISPAPSHRVVKPHSPSS